MDLLGRLNELAEKNDVDVDYWLTSKAPTLSGPLPYGGYGIAINPMLVSTQAEETSALAHELGHCMAGAFYDPTSPQTLVGRCEYKADKWAVEYTITAEELDEAVVGGCTEIWELAERFGVTEDFMRKVVCWHVHHNLDVELYF